MLRQVWEERLFGQALSLLGTWDWAALGRGFKLISHREDTLGITWVSGPFLQQPAAYQTASASFL